MIQNLFKRLWNIALSLRVSILTIFIILFILAMSVLIGVFYINFSKSMQFVAKQLLVQTSDSIFESISTEFAHAKIESESAAKLIQTGLFDINDHSKVLALMGRMMERDKALLLSIHSIYWSDEKGTVLLAERDSHNNISYQEILHGAKASERIIIARDEAGNIIKVGYHPTSYDPRQRAWYIQAKQNNKTAVTNPYIYTFFQAQVWGLTIGTPVWGSNNQFLGVFGENIRLDFLRILIEKFKISKHSVIFIVSEDGKLIAYPHLVQYLNPQLADIHSLSNKAEAKSFDAYLKNLQSEFSFQANNQTYLAVYKKLSEFVPETWYLGVIAPEDDFIGDLKRLNIVTIIVGLSILLLGILVFFILITHAVKAFKRLIIETEKIKNFQLSGNINIKSRIKEVISLAEALENMKRGLRSFQKYVPAALVRQLVQQGLDAQIGGEKKSLVIFFSDIKDFTSIAESTDPNELMTQTCEYLEEVTKIIIQEGGTIDKYIGDAVMAFWGAPTYSEDACFQAAKAALKCQNRLLHVNSMWIQKGFAPFITRIGIHTGEAIVGNLGSSERLNYTALGDVINSASRLESANKLYHTNILISELVYQQVKDRFWLRLVDKVALKGKENQMFIYELFAEKSVELNFDFEKYKQVFLQAFTAYQEQKWQEAIVLFRECQKIFLNDQLSEVFIARCESLKVNPPSSNWDGVWRLEYK